MITAHTPPFPLHSEPADTCIGCQHRAIVGQPPAAWSYCVLHVTPRAKCIHHSPPSAAAPLDRLAGALKCR